MATPQYIKDFNDKFEQPYVAGITVGFSTIDPQQKTIFDAADYDYSKLTPAQQKVIEQMIASYVSKLSIRIDSGNINPAAPEPEPPTVTLRPSEIPHEDLAGLLGGDADGHYHLTDEQYERLTAYPAFDRLIDDIEDDLEHNSLKGLQGGTNNEYYHLRRSDFEALAKLIAALLPNGQTVELPETVDNHEDLIGLLGGDLSGHYHLTKGERDKLSKYPDYDDLAGDLASDIAGDVEHNALKGLQGGKNGERYHLTQEEVNKLAKLAAALMPDGQTVTLPESGTTDHELLTHLLGGASTGHYHLTELEIQGLRKLIAALVPSGGDVELPESGTNDHEALTNILGGGANGHYHLTDAELAGLGKLISTLIPNGGDVELPESGTKDHEALQQLLGGNDDGHYHLTELERLRLQKIIAVLFPAGGDEPIFPYDPSYPDLPSELSGGLPTGTPPNWKINNLPSGYTMFDGVHKMYYGKTPYRLNEVYITALVVPMIYNGDTTKKRYVLTQDLSIWTQMTSTSLTITEYGNNIGQYLYREYDTGSATQIILYTISYPTATKRAIPFIYNLGTSTNDGNVFYASISKDYQYTNKTWIAGCYSPDLDLYIFVTTNSSISNICRMQGTSNQVLKENITCALKNVNPGCAAWSPDALIFCITGSEGTATSAEGLTWDVHTEAPHNLRDLTFREDIGGGNFLAWSEEDRLFYISNDGITWVTYGVLPPAPSEEGATDGLSVITAVDYNPDLQWYCAVGGTGKYAYFSKDLKTWVRTTITNGTTIEAGSVIWMPSTQKYVLMPTSGTYYYTFSPADWEGVEMPNNTALPDTGDDTGDNTGNDTGNNTGE